MIDQNELEDFLDEEVVDQHGRELGILACYWESTPGVPAFYGIRLKGHHRVNVVPVRRSKVDQRHSCIWLGFDAADVETAPAWDCAVDLGTLQGKVYEHFNLLDHVPIKELNFIEGSVGTVS